VSAPLQRFQIYQCQPFATINHQCLSGKFFDLLRFSGAQSWAISANGAYTEDLDLEDTLTARCAFAIEKFPERRNGVSDLRILKPLKASSCNPKSIRFSAHLALNQERKYVWNQWR